MPFSKSNATKIKRNFTSIISQLKLDPILDVLYQEEVLTDDDLERIAHQATNADRNRLFVRLLLQAPPHGYKKFIETLKEDDAYKDLAQQIEDTPVTEEIEKPKTLEDWIGEGCLTPEIEKHYLKDLDLLKYSKALKPTKLKLVVPLLGMTEAELETAKLKYQFSPDSVSHELLIKWRNRTGHSATVGSLLEKLFKASEITPDCIDVDSIRSTLKDQNACYNQGQKKL